MRARRTAGALLLAALAASAALLPALAAGDEKKDDNSGWVQLFDGKDLKGWKVYPSGTGGWKVEDGILVSHGPSSHLFSEGGDYTNFVYRVEAAINDGGNSGQYFRTQFGPGFPKGYEAQINSTHSDPIRTGSLYPSFKLSPEEREKIIVRKELVKPDEWFTQEVIADGNHIVIKVNGQKTVDFVDENNTYTKGHFALQHHDPTCTVKFRKIEYKPLALRPHGPRGSRRTILMTGRARPGWGERWRGPCMATRRPATWLPCRGSASESSPRSSR